MTGVIIWHPKGASGWNHLHLAASTGDIATLKQLIRLSKQASDDDRLSLPSQRENKLDIATKGGDRAVHIALRKGKVEAARELVAAGCDIRVPGARGETALHIAASRGLIEVINWLIQDFHLNIHAVTNHGSTCAHFAAEQDRCDTLRHLEKLKVKFDVQDDNGDTCLHVAARNGSVGAVMWLADHDPSLIRKLNRSQKDAEAVARDAGRSEAAAVLKKAKQAKKREKKTTMDFHKRLSEGESLENIKVWLEKVSESDMLLLVDTVNTRTGTNALLEACVGGHVDVCKFLLAFPGKRDLINIKTGATALQIAAANGHLKLVEYLLKDLEMDPSRADANGSNAIWAAEKGGHSEIFHLLKEWEEKRSTFRRPGSSTNLSQVSSFPATLQARQSSETSEVSSEPSTNSSINPVSSPHLQVSDEVSDILENAGLSSLWISKLADEGFTTKNNLMLLMEGDLVHMQMPRGFRRALLQQVDILKIEEKNKKGGSDEKTTNLQIKQVITKVEGSPHPKKTISPIPRFRSDNLAALPHDLTEGVRIDLMVPSMDSKRQNLHYQLMKTGPIYSCSCSYWKDQRVSEEFRTCEHLKLIRGEEREHLRISHETMSMQSPDQMSETRWVSSSGQRKKENQEVPDHFVIKWDELIFEKIIGEGSFGVVRLASWRGMKVAVKELKMGITTSLTQQADEEAELRREASTMARVSNHDNVVNLVGMVLFPRPSVVMAFMPGGSVEELLVLRGSKCIRSRIPLYAVFKMLRDAAAGVFHLHQQSVIHRDISARNLLVDSTGAVRVADFGFARVKEGSLSKGYTASHVGVRFINLIYIYSSMY